MAKGGKGYRTSKNGKRYYYSYEPKGTGKAGRKAGGGGGGGGAGGELPHATTETKNGTTTVKSSSGQTMLEMPSDWPKAPAGVGPAKSAPTRPGTPAPGIGPKTSAPPAKPVGAKWETPPKLPDIPGKPQATYMEKLKAANQAKNAAPRSNSNGARYKKLEGADYPAWEKTRQTVKKGQAYDRAMAEDKAAGHNPWTGPGPAERRLLGLSNSNGKRHSSKPGKK